MALVRTPVSLSREASPLSVGVTHQFAKCAIVLLKLLFSNEYLQNFTRARYNVHYSTHIIHKDPSIHTRVFRYGPSVVSVWAQPLVIAVNSARNELEASTQQHTEGNHVLNTIGLSRSRCRRCSQFARPSHTRMIGVP